jgi:hypothetical protein
MMLADHWLTIAGGRVWPGLRVSSRVLTPWHGQQAAAPRKLRVSKSVVAGDSPSEPPAAADQVAAARIRATHNADP